jgi:hypothetical protein
VPDTSGQQVDALGVIRALQAQRNLALDKAAEWEALASQRAAEINDLRAQLAAQQKEA